MAVLAVAEHRRGDLRDPSFEVLTAARQLADAADTDLHVLVAGGAVDEFASELQREGVDVVHTVDHGEEFDQEVLAQAVEALVADEAVEHVVLANTVNGLASAPAIAERLEWPLATDAVGVDVDDEVVVTREFYGGKAEGTVTVEGPSTVLTVRPGEWPAAGGAGDADVNPLELDVDESRIRTRTTGFQEVGAGDVDITDADVLVSVGRGIEEEENLVLVEALADALGATLSASRPIVDNEWLPKDRQVGQSGKVVTPDVYLAIGISGAVQHVAGMKGAETIVAINTDPSAPIFDVADYGIEGDLFEVVPALIAEFGGDVPDV